MNKPLNILIVEDSKDDVLLMLREIKQAGYSPNFKWVDNPEDMAFALDTSEWDIIISDYVMPRFSGLEALRLFKDRKLKVPFIIISGKIKEDKAIESLKFGADNYVMKNNLSNFINVIEKELFKNKIEEEKEQFNKNNGNSINEIIHDLKSPLTSILGYAKLISNPSLGEISLKKLEYSNKIYKAGIFMLDLINNLLDIYQIDQEEMKYIFKDFELKELLSELQDIFIPLASQNKIAFICACPEKEIWINGDREKIKLVFCNLINNALRYTKEGGTIQISCNIQGDYVSVKVLDDGCGIPEDLHDKIFQRFFKLNQNEEGNGLGLYIAKKFLEKHDSNIYIESAYGKGTKFFFNLKMAKSIFN